MKISKTADKKHPNAVAKVFIVGLSVLLAICLVPAILNLSINQTVFKTNFYAVVLDRTDFYDQIPTVIVDAVMFSGASTFNVDYFAGLDQQQFVWLMTSMLPPGWIETQTTGAMTSVLDFLNFKTDTLSITVDLQPIKDYLISDTGKQALIYLLTNLPDCTDEQLTQIMIAMQSGNGGFAFCHPPAMEYFNMDTMLDPVIYSFASSLPTVILIPPANQVGTMDAIIQSPIFQIYKNIRTILIFFPWICLVLALLIILLSLRSLHWLSISLGLPLVFASLVTAIPGVWLFLSGGRDFGALFAHTDLGSFQGIEDLLVKVFQQGLQVAGQSLLVWCLAGLTIGLVLLVIWIITKKQVTS